jgi:hypothetical protein
MGIDQGASDSALVPSPEDMMTPPGVPTPEGQVNAMETGPGGTVIQLPTNRIQQSQRPPESDEARAGMPFAGRLVRIDDEEFRTSGASLQDGPSHVGMRRHSKVTKDTPLGDEPGYVEPVEPEEDVS